MANKKKLKHIFFDEEQIEELNKKAKQTGVSFSGVVRYEIFGKNKEPIF